MTVEKAIEEVQFNMSRIGLGARAARRVKEAKEMAIEALKKVQAFEAIGTIDEFKALKEKNVAKKPIETMMCYKAVWKCPACNCRLYSGQSHCEECGQAILDDYE